uniref:Secreted protein n=1 Tax=Cacopsylla melanoneura TaxID=428564 RepID=A0A8D9AH96_9HEMI
MLCFVLIFFFFFFFQSAFGNNRHRQSDRKTFCKFLIFGSVPTKTSKFSFKSFYFILSILNLNSYLPVLLGTYFVRCFMKSWFGQLGCLSVQCTVSSINHGVECGRPTSVSRNGKLKSL